MLITTRLITCKFPSVSFFAGERRKVGDSELTFSVNLNQNPPIVSNELTRNRLTGAQKVRQ
jgi:hypothetical protein